ncbi:MAG: transposase [Treponema sp.]|nr:transposase [Treponema sp.]
MRPLRLLKQGVWYEIHTPINNREPLFRKPRALEILATVFHETKGRFVFEIRGLRLGDDRLTFYIKPAKGMELPTIMKWLKQVFAQRYNHAQAREGHIWGDRYGSRILEGEPPEAEVAGEDRDMRVRPPYREAETKTAFLRLFPFPLVPTPG